MVRHPVSVDADFSRELREWIGGAVLENLRLSKLVDSLMKERKPDEAHD